MTEDEAVGPTAATRRFDLSGVLAVASGHLLHDTYSAFLFPLLPLLIDKLSLSLTVAGSLTLIMRLPSLFQPLIGYAADRVNLRYFVILAPAVTAVMMSMIGLAPNLGVLIVMILVVGVASAAFHAPTPAAISRLAGSRLGLALSFYQMGGELARTVGPLLIVAGVSAWTLEGTYRLMILGLAASGVLYWRLSKVSFSPEVRSQPALGQYIREMRPMIIPLSGIMLARAFMTAALTTYLPTYIDSLGGSLWLAGASLSIVEGAGVVGVLVAGTLSDRLGRRRVLLFNLTAAPLLLLAFVATSGWATYPILMLLGFTSLSILPVLLASILEYHTENRATASGVFMALSFVLVSVATLILGYIGDTWGLGTAFTWSAIVGFVSLPFVLMMPMGEAGVRSGARPHIAG